MPIYGRALGHQEDEVARLEDFFLDRSASRYVADVAAWRGLSAGMVEGTSSWAPMPAHYVPPSARPATAGANPRSQPQLQLQQQRQQQLSRRPASSPGRRQNKLVAYDTVEGRKLVAYDTVEGRTAAAAPSPPQARRARSAPSARRPTAPPSRATKLFGPHATSMAASPAGGGGAAKPANPPMRFTAGSRSRYNSGTADPRWEVMGSYPGDAPVQRPVSSPARGRAWTRTDAPDASYDPFDSSAVFRTAGHPSATSRHGAYGHRTTPKSLYTRQLQRQRELALKRQRQRRLPQRMSTGPPTMVTTTASRGGITLSGGASTLATRDQATLRPAIKRASPHAVRSDGDPGADGVDAAEPASPLTAAPSLALARGDAEASELGGGAVTPGALHLADLILSGGERAISQEDHLTAQYLDQLRNRGFYEPNAKRPGERQADQQTIGDEDLHQRVTRLSSSPAHLQLQRMIAKRSPFGTPWGVGTSSAVEAAMQSDGARVAFGGGVLI